MSSAQQTATQLYDAFAEGDMDSLARLLGDVEWHEASGMPYGGTYRGLDEVAANVFGPIGEDVSGFTARPDEILPLGEDRAVAFGTYRGCDGTVATPFCHVWTASDGRMTKFVQYADTHLFREQLAEAKG